MQVFGGCNSDPDSWDVYENLLSYGCGPCLVTQNIESYNTVLYYPMKFGTITCVRNLANGMIVVGTCMGSVLLIDPISKTILSTIDFDSSITHCAIYNNNIVISTALNGIKILEVNENREIQEIEAIFEDLRCVALGMIMIKDEIIIGMGMPNGSVMLYSKETKSQVILEGAAWTTCIKFCKESDDSFLCAASSQEDVIRIWKVTIEDKSIISKLNVSMKSHATLLLKGCSLHVELFANLTGHNDWVNSVDFYNFEHLVSASYDGQVLIWKSQEGGDYDISCRLGTTAVEDDQSGFICCKLIGENDVIALSRNGGFSRWIDGKSVRCFAGHFDSVTSVAWTTIGCFISTGLDNVARVYGIVGDNYQEIARPLIHGHAIYDVVEIDDDLYAFASDEKNVRVLMPSACFAHIHPGILSSKKLPFASMVRPLSLDNATIENPVDVEANFAPLTPSDFMKDKIPDSHEMWLTRWPEQKSLFAHERELRQMTVARDWFASGDDRGGYIIWDKKLLEKRGNYIREESKSLTTALEASPDSSLLLVVLQNGLVKLVDPETTLPIKVFNVDKNSFSGGWARNSQYFAVGGEKGLFIYERDGQLSGHLKGKYVTSIQYIDDYELLIGLDDGDIEQIRYEPSEQKFDLINKYQGHGLRVNDIRFNYQTHQFLSCGADHVIILQNLI